MANRNFFLEALELFKNMETAATAVPLHHRLITSNHRGSTNSQGEYLNNRAVPTKPL
jgi:hypothetical protein